MPSGESHANNHSPDGLPGRRHCLRRHRDRSQTHPASATRAQDYNSSRSNTTSLRQSDDPVLRKRPGRTTAKTEAVQPSRPPSRAVSAQDYNSSRSNIGAAGPVDNDEDSDSDLMYDGCERTVGDGVDDDCDGVRGTAAPANHNTTRSNRTID